MSIFEGDRVINAPPTIYDEFLVEAASTLINYPNGLIATSVHAKVDFCVSLGFPMDRVKVLRKEGKI